MSKVTSDKAAEIVGNRFELVLIATDRAREISKGSSPRLRTNSKPTSAALEEIEEGLYTKQEWLENKRTKR